MYLWWMDFLLFHFGRGEYKIKRHIIPFNILGLHNSVSLYIALFAGHIQRKDEILALWSLDHKSNESFADSKRLYSLRMLSECCSLWIQHVVPLCLRIYYQLSVWLQSS
jgi:hypothetical protein